MLQGKVGGKCKYCILMHVDVRSYIFICLSIQYFTTSKENVTDNILRNFISIIS